MSVEGRKQKGVPCPSGVDVRALMGSACLWSWVGALYMSAFFVPFGRQGGMAEAATWGASLLGVPICLAFLWKRERACKALASRGALWASGTAGVAASLLLIWSAQTGSLALLGLGALLGALFMAVAVVSWGSLYCSGGMRTVTLYVAGAFACTPVPNVVFSLLVPPVSAYAFALLPLASMALLALVDPQSRAYDPEAPVCPRGPSTPAGRLHRILGISPAAVCGLMLIMLGIGYMEHRVSFSASPNLPFASDGLVVQLVHGVVAAVLFAVMTFWPKHAAAVYRAGLLVIIAGFSLMPFLYGSAGFWASGAVIIAGYVTFDVLVWIIVAQSAHSKRLDAFVGVCVMRVLINGTFCSLGGLLAMGVSNLGISTAFACADAVLVGYVVTVAVVLVLSSRGVWELFEPVCDPGGPAPAPSLSERMQALAEEWGLTARERDVFELLAVGRTQPWVAAHLGISENTVDSHVRRIYAKSGVNCRQDLLDLVFCTQSRERHEGAS